MRRRHQPEAALQRAVLQHLRLRASPNVFYFHCPNGGARRPIEASILKGLGVVAGVPDLIIIRNGKTFGLELKSAGGKLSDNQKMAHDALRVAGAEGGVAFNIDDALCLLEAWQILRGTTQISKEGI